MYPIKEIWQIKDIIQIEVKVIVLAMVAEIRKKFDLLNSQKFASEENK